MMTSSIKNMRLISQDPLRGFGGIGEGMIIQTAPNGRRIMWLAHEGPPKNFTGVDVTDLKNPRVIVQTDLPHNKVRSNSLDLVGDILAVAYQTLGPKGLGDPGHGLEPAGIELFDVSVPENPRSIAFFDCSGPHSMGVHQVWFVDGRYIHFAKSCFPEDLRLDGMKVVIDCAHGAAYNVAPLALWELGADIVPIGVAPNGTNINDKCGSTAPSALQETVVASGAQIGIALDGDADRLIIVDEHGHVVDGDQIMALIGSSWARNGTLKGGGVVATVMSNLGLERFLMGEGLTLERTKVGDRYVLERMREGGFNVGGEQSGHMILADYGTTGDGLVAALQVLAELVRQQKAASDVLHLFDPVPQLLKNVRFSGGKPLENDAVKAVIAQAEGELNGSGRLVIRPSGTEPVIRVMAEGDDAAQVERVVDAICDAVREAAA